MIAPHGGDIERHTDEQAEQVASRLAAKAGSCWRCKGWKGGAGALVRWHFTSTGVSAPSFPRLDPVISRGFTHAVAFHGFEDPEIDTDVINGGCAPEELKVGGSPPRSTRHGRFGPARACGAYGTGHDEPAPPWPTNSPATATPPCVGPARFCCCSYSAS